MKMTDLFTDALLSAENGKIPEEYDWFAPLLGDWDCDYFDEFGGNPRHVKGEWMFRRILEGVGIQDVFIFPSRATKESQPQPDGEYGTSLRMFNRGEGCYDVVYTCDHCMKRLRFTKEGEELVGKVLDEENAFWIFTDLSENRFRWLNVRTDEEGNRAPICEIIGKRIG